MGDPVVGRTQPRVTPQMLGGGGGDAADRVPPSPPQTCLEDFVTSIRVAVNFSLHPEDPRGAPGLVLNPESTAGWTEVGSGGVPSPDPDPTAGFGAG